MFSVRSLRSVMSRAPRVALAVRQQHLRSYTFASESYAQSFGDLPEFDGTVLRKATVDYIKNHDAKEWYNDPITTVLNGKVLEGGKELTTYNAFNEENGIMVHAPADVVDQVIAHMQNYKPTETDLRTQVRLVEQELLSVKYASMLVGNQAIDFKKQDGITEIEESTEANTVERRLNDLLIADEQAGVVQLGRHPALIGCVSNFTNFLDLFRKTIRNLELGVPVVVLSRGNTAQHTYRWFQLLSSLLKKHGVDAGMLTHASCDVAQQRRIMSANPGSPLYFTGSRPVSEAIKEVCPMLMSSTGGPNTMVASTWTPPIAEALRMSAAIEHSGQCTALRHLVAPNMHAQDIENAFASTKEVQNSAEALAAGEFSAVFKGVGKKPDVGYTAHPSLPVAYKISERELPGDEIDEKWREVYVDVTSTASGDLEDPAYLSKIGAWLVKHQPISLAVNGPDFESAFKLAAPLFEQTCMVVYTVGGGEQPALTAQARPQDAEIFGEFPPRAQLSKYTKFPVVGPSPTPGYDACYTEQHLASMEKASSPAGLEYCDALIEQVTSPKMRGYLHVLLNYLDEAAVGGREGHGQRTSLWGLQRPPLSASGHTVIRAGKETTLDDLAVSLLPFLATNARDQVTVSVSASNAAVQKALSALPVKMNVVVESTDAFEAGCESNSPWNVIRPTACDFALVGHQVSLLFPLGHIKCTRANDSDFITFFKASPKWLRADRR